MPDHADCHSASWKAGDNPQAMVRKFFWIGLLCLALVLIVTSYGIYRIYSWRLLESAHAEAKAACQVILVKEKKHLLEIDGHAGARLNLPASEQAGFSRRMQKYFKPFAIDTIRIWNPRKRLVHQTDYGSSPATPPTSEALDKALAGESLSLLARSPHATGITRSFFTSAAQAVSYLPLWGRNREVLGAIEIRKGVAAYQTEIRRGTTSFIVLLGGALVGLFGCVLLLVKRGAERLAKAQHILNVLATTDPLTGLYNRREALHKAEQDFVRRRGEVDGSQKPVAFGVLMLDVDDFKQINDTYGHAAGDRLLQELAQRLREVLRPTDILGRIGGEEFLVALPDSSLGHCREVAERLCRTVREAPFILDGVKVHSSISIGGATAHSLDKDLAALLQRADKSLYESKNLGKDRVCLAPGNVSAGEFSDRLPSCPISG